VVARRPGNLCNNSRWKPRESGIRVVVRAAARLQSRSGIKYNTSTLIWLLTIGNICASMSCDSSTPACRVAPSYFHSACCSFTLRQERVFPALSFQSLAHSYYLQERDTLFVFIFLRTLLHFFVFFCTYENLNFILFMRLRTLRQKTGGGAPPYTSVDGSTLERAAYSNWASTSGTSSRVSARSSRRTISAENPARSRLRYMEAIFFSSISPR